MTKPEEHGQWSTFTQSPANALAPAANLTRDQNGRFLTGNSGGGRPRGSRNKLTERFLDTIANDFAEHGAEAVAKLRTDDPATYLKIVGSLVPRELIMQREEGFPTNFGGMTDEEIIEVIEQRRRQKAVEEVLKSIG